MKIVHLFHVFFADQSTHEHIFIFRRAHFDISRNQMMINLFKVDSMQKDICTNQNQLSKYFEYYYKTKQLYLLIYFSNIFQAL